MTVRTHAREQPRMRLTGRAALLVITFVVLAMFLSVPIREYLAQQAEIGGLERRAAELERANDGLRADMHRLHDPDYLERLARACLGMVKPGEVAFVSRTSGTDPAC